MDPSRGDARYNLNYSMSSIGLSLVDQADMYGNPTTVASLSGRPPGSGLLQSMGGSSGMGIGGRSSSLLGNTAQCQPLVSSSANSSAGSSQQRGVKRAVSDCYDDHHRNSSTSITGQSIQGLESCTAGGNGQHASQQQTSNTAENPEENYGALQGKKSPPANGKKTKGRVKIKMEYIDNKLRRYTTFSKRKTGIMKKAYELSTLTGTQVMLLVASETGHVYTFATRKLQPMITSEAGKQLIQTCLNSPDPPSVGGGDQRMSATGFEETELSYNIADEDSKDERSPMSSANESEESSDIDSPGPSVSITQSAVNKSKLGLNEPRLDHNSALSRTVVRTNKFDQSCLKTTPSLPQMLEKNTSAQEPSCASNTTSNITFQSPVTSNIPQDILLQLIQSGHLQLHTEEDGSGHQYVAIPLSSKVANYLKKKQRDETKLAKENTLSERAQHVSNGAVLRIKSELE